MESAVGPEQGKDERNQSALFPSVKGKCSELTQSIIIRPTPPVANRTSTPMVRDESIYHDGHSDKTEHGCADPPDLVAEV
jgi:hypothetical protein